MNDNSVPFSIPVLGSAWAGLDVAKKTFDAALYFPLGPDLPPRPFEQIPTASFQRTTEGAAAFLKWSDEQIASFNGKNAAAETPALRAVMEATGRYSIELAAWLVEARPTLRPAIINPKAASDFAKSLRVRNLTDRVAARCLARFGYDNKPEPPACAPPEYAELRELSRQRDALVAARVAAENRKSEVTAFKSVAKIQNQLVCELEKLEQRVEDAIKKLISKHAPLGKALRRLQTIPGVGWVTAVAVLAEAGDLCRFARSRQLSAFAGLSPRTHDSGTSVHKRPRLSKQGTGRLRQALYLSAMTAVRGAGPMRDFYENMIANHKPKMMALGAVMRKQLLLMRAVMVSETDYQADYVSPRNRLRIAPSACA